MTRLEGVEEEGVDDGAHGRVQITGLVAQYHVEGRPAGTLQGVHIHAIHTCTPTYIHKRHSIHEIR